MAYTGALYTLPAMSHSAISMAHTPPAWRAGPPNCLILRNNLVELQRVLAQNPTLQKQSVGCAGAVTNFAESIYSLIGIDANDRAGTGPGLDDRGHAQIRNLERRGTRVGVDALGIGLRGSPSRRAAPSAPAVVFRTSRRLIEGLALLLMSRSSFLAQVASRVMGHEDRFNNFPTLDRCGRERPARAGVSSRSNRGVSHSDGGRVSRSSDRADAWPSQPFTAQCLTNLLLFETLRRRRQPMTGIAMTNSIRTIDHPDPQHGACCLRQRRWPAHK